MAVYDPIATQYKEFRQHQIYDIYCYVETYTYLTKLGDISGKSILDLGCGEGIHSRNFKKNGAAQVVGVDISPKMIELAREQEAKEPLGIEYIVSDMCELGKIDSFDLVGAAYSINHAQTKDQLRQMCQTIYDNLKPGGRFVALNNNVGLSPESYKRIEKYGYYRDTHISNFQDGMAIPSLAFDVNGEQIVIDDYYLSQETYEWAFKEVGFKTVNWYKPMISPEGIEKFGQNYWQDLLDNPPMRLIECQK
jgi:SAM-dependent methyltransferase